MTFRLSRLTFRIRGLCSMGEMYPGMAVIKLGLYLLKYSGQSSGSKFGMSTTVALMVSGMCMLMSEPYTTKGTTRFRNTGSFLSRWKM